MTEGRWAILLSAAALVGSIYVNIYKTDINTADVKQLKEDYSKLEQRVVLNEQVGKQVIKLADAVDKNTATVANVLGVLQSNTDTLTKIEKRQWEWQKQQREN